MHRSSAFSSLAFSVFALLALAFTSLAQSVSVTAPQDGDRIVPGTPFVVSASATSIGALVPPTGPDNTSGPVTGVEFFLVPNRGVEGPVPLPGGLAAEATVNLGGGISFIGVTNPGRSYATPPSVTIAGDGDGATARANINADGQVVSVTVINPGSGYTPGETLVTIDPPIADDGVRAAAVAGFSLDPATVIITPAPGYDPNFPPEVVIAPPNLVGGTQAVATALVDPDGTLSGLIFDNEGTGYTTPPVVTIPSARAVFSVGVATLNPFVLGSISLPGNDRYTIYAVASYLGGGSAESGGGSTGPVVIGEQGVVPTVEITAPTATTGFLAAQSILVQAKATFNPPTPAAGDAVEEFELFINGVSAGTSATPLFEYTPTTAGFYTLVVRATTFRGLVADSAPRTLDVTAGTAPTIVIDAPVPPSPDGPFEMKLNEEVTIRAVPTISQLGANVQNVAFIFNGVIRASLGPVAAGESYNFVWRADSVGRYDVIARVTDNLGNVVDSLPVWINVTVGSTPSATLNVTPSSGVKVGQTITAAASIIKGDGDIVQAELLLDGVPAATVGANPVLAPGPFVFQVQMSAAGNNELKVRVTDALGNIVDSAPVTLNVTEGDAPSVMFSMLPGNAVQLGEEVTLRAAPTQGSSALTQVEYFANGAGLGVVASPGPYDLTFTATSVGALVIEARVSDVAGNVVSSGEQTLTVSEGTPPTVTLAATPTEVEAGRPVQLNASVVNGSRNVDQVEFFVDGSSVGAVAAPGPYSLSYTASTTGTLVVTARATDTAGNVGVSAPVDVTVTTGTAPSVALSVTPNSGVKVGQSVSLSALPTAGSGAITQVEFFANGGSLGAVAAPGPYVLTNVPLNLTGNVVFTARVSDDLGNVVQSNAVTVNVTQGLPPTNVAITSPSISAPYSMKAGESVLVSATADAANGRNIVRVDFISNGSVVNSTSNTPYQFAYTVPNAGYYEVIVRATDDLGNQTDSSPLYLNVTQGNPASASLTLMPASGVKVGQTVTVSVTVTKGDGDIVSADLLINGVVSSTVLAPGPYVYPVQMSAAGNYELKVRVTDTLGNVSDTNPRTVNVTAGDAPSVMFSMLPGNAVQLGEEVTLRAAPTQGSSALTRVEYFANGSSLGVVAAPGPYDLTFAATSVGALVIEARVSDVAGNVVSSGEQVLTVSEGTPPNVTLAATPTEVEAGRPVQLNASVVNGSRNTAQVEFFVDGSSVGAVAAPGPYSLTYTASTTGTLVVTARATDTAGNVGVSNAVNLTVTTGTAPSVALSVTPNSGVKVGQSVSLSALPTAGSGAITQVEFFANGGSLGAVAAPGPYVLPNLPLNLTGNVIFTARVSDDLGNVVQSNAVTVNVTAGTPPSATITSPLAGDTLTPGIPVTIIADVRGGSGTVTQVDFFVNSQLVGSATAQPFFSEFTPPALGCYTIVVRVTDSLGNVAESNPEEVCAVEPVGSLPTVLITQPIGEVDYVTGSSLFLNARATDTPPGQVDPDSVGFTVNGLPISGAIIGQIGDVYGVRYTPTVPFAIDSIRAQATDDNGNTAFSQPNFIALSVAQAPLPQVQMLDLLPSSPLDAGGTIKLRAEAFFPPTASQQARVEFYANNVYVGTATQDTTNPRIYTLDWKSPITPAAYIVEARAVALNWFTNEANNNVREFFASVISDNNVAVNTIPGTAPEVAITAPTNGSTVAVGQALTVRAAASVPSPSGPSVTEVTSPQAGTVTTIRVAVGQAIVVGTPLVDIQVAPGFSGTVTSTLVGTVKSIAVVPGSVVSAGSLLLEVIPVTTVTAPSAAAGGTVTSVAAVGTVVQVGTPLVGVTLPGGFTGTINSPIAGVVTDISVTTGQVLLGGEAVAKVEPGGGSSGTISSVEFYANGVLLGADNTAPYSFEFTPDSVGLYNLNAIALSNAGLIATSANVSVSATLGSQPSVRITRPTQATATANLGSGVTLGKVTSITVGSSGSGYTTAPLVTVSAPPPSGVQATATAILGTGSAAGKVTGFNITESGVGYTAAPTVAIAPPSGMLGSSLLVQADVSDSDGTIAQVEFLVNGLVVQTLTTAPYSYTLPLSSTGVYSLQVRATDNIGNVGVSAVEQFVVTQGTPPVVAITSPANGANLPAGQPVTITANASDTDGSVVRVTFYQNGMQIGDPDTQAPYSASFTPSSPGQYTLVAVALDNSGNLTESAPVLVTVPSTVVITTVVSPANAASFTLGTPVILSATAATTVGSTITSVRFEINNQPVGAPIIKSPYTTSFEPQALGSYTVRSIATDSSGNTGISAPVTFTVKEPVGSPPSIWLSQPSQGNYLTAGSSVFLNYTTFDTEGEIDPATLRIFVNGVALTNPAPQRIGPAGQTFGVRWTPGVAGNYVVSAQISDLDGNTASSGVSTFTVLSAQKTVPQVTIEPYFSDSQYLAVNEPIELRARAKFFANTEPVVEFYANGVFVGTGTAAASNSDGTVSYSLVWSPDVAGSPITLTARAVGINFTQAEFTPDPDGDTIVVSRNVYASTISSNRPTPPVTDLTINEVALAPVPGSNEAFVKFIIPTIFNRPAAYSEYKYYVDQLDTAEDDGIPAPNARALVIEEMLSTVEYNSSYNVVYSFYYRLGLTPTRAAAATQIANVQNDTAAEAGFATHTLFQPQAPNLPTIGMSLAAQNLLATLPNQTTVGLTPNVTKAISQFSPGEFLNWLVIKLRGQAFDAQAMVNAMNAYTPQLRRQGGALAFLTQLYATYATTNQNIADNRPSTLGARNPDFRAENLAYDAKLKGITINFLLTGVWNTATAPLSNAMLAALLTNSAPGALPVITSGNAVGTVGEYFTYQIEATKNPGGYTAVDLPAWLRLDPQTGLLSGRPGSGDAGIHEVLIGAQNWAGEGTKLVTFTIDSTIMAQTARQNRETLMEVLGFESQASLPFGSEGGSQNDQSTDGIVDEGFEMTWVRLKNSAAYGISYELLKASADLSTWTTVTLSPEQVEVVEDNVILPNLEYYERVRVVLPVDSSKAFYRVKANILE